MFGYPLRFVVLLGTILVGEQLFNTMLLGIPTGFLPTLAAIQPVAPMGQLLMTGIDLFYVAGVIAMAMLVLSSAFKIRELFNGTTRDLADPPDLRRRHAGPRPRFS